MTFIPHYNVPEEFEAKARQLMAGMRVVRDHRPAPRLDLRFDPLAVDEIGDDEFAELAWRNALPKLLFEAAAGRLTVQPYRRRRLTWRERLTGWTRP